MFDLSQKEFQHLLAGYLREEDFGDLFPVESVHVPNKSKRKRPPLIISLRRRLQWYLGRLELRFTDFGTREYWIPDKSAPRLRFSDAAMVCRPDMDVAVHMHVYFLDLLPELLFATQSIGLPFTCYVTTDTHSKASVISALLKAHPQIKSSKVIVSPNRGRDIAPWVIEMAPFNDHHELWCHIHTKKSVHVKGNLGDNWRHFILSCLLGGRNRTRQILDTFAKDPSLGIVIPPFYTRSVHRPFSEWDNRREARKFFASLGIEMAPPKQPVFSAGSMSWYRPQALSKLFKKGFTYDDFEPETSQVGGTLAHLVERSLVYLALDSERSFRVIDPD